MPEDEVYAPGGSETANAHDTSDAAEGTSDAEGFDSGVPSQSRPDGAQNSAAETADSGAKISLHRPRLKVKPAGSNPESRFSVLTAVISAIAALLGALIGAVASYEIAKSNSAHEISAAQVTRRQTTYAEFLTDEIDCRDYAQALVDTLEGRPSNPLIPGGFQLQAYEALRGKAKKVEYIVGLDDSVNVENWRKEISRRQDDINVEVKKLYQQAARYGQKADRHTLDTLAKEIQDLETPFHDFSVAARADLLPTS